MGSGFPGPLLLVNPRSGRPTPTVDELVAEAERLGIDCRVVAPGEEAGLLAREAADRGVSVLGMAGGDGSLAGVAAVSLERELPFVPIPFGTRNHFARDAGFDRDDPIAALGAFSGEERRVDIGTVCGRVFLNNVSLGVYAEMLGDPEYRDDKLGVAQAKLQAIFSDPELRRALRITPPDEAPLEGIIAMVVSNNTYEFARWDRLVQRYRLDTGMLQVSVWMPARLRSSKGCSRAPRCSAPPPGCAPLYATGCLSAWRWASLARECRLEWTTS